MRLTTIASVLFFPILTLAQNQLTMSAESAKEGQDEICDDLFGASCMGADGKPKYQGRSKSLPLARISHTNEISDVL
ncbi:MAG: hypothetical protein HC883_03760 [Bdellovibrionaceae bacterium]|nr:hypothetical protein [Pseudobdellovibrionaceae bacterium]